MAQKAGRSSPIYDLPIALGLLAAQELLPASALLGVLAAGELALDGSLRATHGAVNLSLLAASTGDAVLLPQVSAAEAALIEGVPVLGAPTLRAAAEHLGGQRPLVITPTPEPLPDPDELLDLLDIRGQGQAKRALEIALAGGHNLLMVGSPGSGKTMLARRAPSLLPRLSRPEALEVTRIHSAAGMLTGRGGLVQTPPHRAPHHTVSDAGLIGGGGVPRPGEVSLAHRGVLFLDEFPEFSRRALETLRQPLEDGEVLISRARASVRFPAQFQLIAAMNPCPCGYLGDSERACTCSPVSRSRYAAKISGPLLDRIDLTVKVPRLTVDELSRAEGGEASAVVRGRLEQARQRMIDRQGERNGLLFGEGLRAQTRLAAGPEAFARSAAKNLNLTGRGYDRVLRVARTVADLAGSDDISEVHLAEAVAYRVRTLS